MAAFYQVNIQMANNEELRQNFALADDLDAPVDLTGAVLRMDIENLDGNSLISLSTGNGSISILNAALGQFEIFVPASQMATYNAGVYRHDLLLSLTSHVQRVWEGTLTLSQGITQ